MKHIRNLILVFSFLMISVESFGQIDNKCDAIYSFVDFMSEYANGIHGLMDYLNKDLILILSDCIQRDSILIASMYLTLTIDNEGKVIDVDFIQINATDQCKSDLKKKILTMPSWTPGKLNGKAVCCKFSWPISCIMWQ
jgi:hypothetical protein